MRVADDEPPRAVGLVAQDLDRFLIGLDRLPRRLDRGALKVGVEDGDIARDDRLHDPALHVRFRVDQSGQYAPQLFTPIV